MVALVQYAAPGAEPLVLADVKANLRIDDTAEDALLTSLILASRQAAETYAGRALLTQTWDLHLDRFPAGRIPLPKPPLQSVSAITYVDTAGATQTLAADQYQVDSVGEPGGVQPAYGLTWPATREQPNAVKVRFVCGYGAAGSAVPAEILRWMQLQIGHWYVQRQGTSDKALLVTPYTDALIQAHVVRSFDHYAGW